MFKAESHPKAVFCHVIQKLSEKKTELHKMPSSQKGGKGGGGL